MSQTKRRWCLVGLAVLSVFLVFSCRLQLPETSGSSQWYIKLNIGTSGNKAISVDEYPVTGLEIVVNDPDHQVLQTISWAAVEGPQSYLIPVTQAGQHEIVVTHISDNNGEPVEATESTLFNIAAMVITVINITPGAIGMVDINGDGGEEPIVLTGYWDTYLTPNGGDTEPPHLIYIRQTDSLLDSFGVSGSVDGQVVTMTMDDGSATFTGTIGTGDTLGGTFDWMGATGTFEMVPSDLLFGLFEINGLVNLSTDKGLGYQSENEIEYRLDFHMEAGTLQGALTFFNHTGLAPGSYSVIPMEGEEEPGPTEVNGWFFEGWETEHEMQSGSLTLMQYDVTGASGFFAVDFGEGNYLNGSFDLSGPTYSGGVVTITEGYWDGIPVTPETAGGMIWSAGLEYQWGRCEIQYLDEDREVWLDFEPSFGPMEAGVFSVPDQVWVHVADQSDEGSGFESEAQSGTLVITSCVEGVGMEGYFENMVFPGGTLSGSFDVSFQTTLYN